MAHDAVVIRLRAGRGFTARIERKGPGSDEHEDLSLIRVIAHVTEDVLGRGRADSPFERPALGLHVPDGIAPKKTCNQNEGNDPAVRAQQALNLDQARAPVKHAKGDDGNQIAIVVERPNQQRHQIEDEENLENGRAPAAAPQEAQQCYTCRDSAQEELHEPLVAFPETAELVPVDAQIVQDEARVKLQRLDVALFQWKTQPLELVSHEEYPRRDPSGPADLPDPQ